ncbi:MAG: hypothetical protein EOP52_12300 [Sphingobacteriales bacterium]|nr:MAG: hypothetical protein EOP52_12300 [Sphingobacteriales bacterium]
MAATAFVSQKGWSHFSLFVLVVALLGNLCVLTNPYLWFDDANQFYISLGIPRDTAPFAPWGAFSDIVRENNRYLFDPLGYSLLLRVWQELSTAVVWIRSLSLWGTVGLLWTAYRLLRTLDIAKTEAILLTGLLLSSPLLYQFSGELRPYSYEAWGTLYALLLAYRYQPGKSIRWLLGQGLALSFFMCMRYPVVIPIGLASFLMVWKTLKAPTASGTYFKRLGAFGAPLALNAVFIYLCCIRQQPVDSNGLSYSFSSMLYYGTAFLLHPWTAVFHLFVLLFAITFLFRKPVQGRYRKQVVLLGIFTGLSFLIWNLLSAVGTIAADPNTRWAIGLNAIAMLCLCVTAAMLLQRVRSSWLPVAYIALAALVLFRPLLMTSRWASGNRMYFGSPYMVAEMSQDAKKIKGPIWISEGMNRDIKYLYEYGALKKEQQADGYPQHFVLFNTQNGTAILEQLPLHQKVAWWGITNRFEKDDRFRTTPIPGASFYKWLWRVR